MNAFRVTFANGDHFVTSMNANLDEARRYYIRQLFQFGDTDTHPADLLVEATTVEDITSHCEHGVTGDCLQCATDRVVLAGAYRDIEGKSGGNRRQEP